MTFKKVNLEKAFFYLLFSLTLTVTSCDRNDEHEEPKPIEQPVQAEPENPECITKASEENGNIIEGEYIIKYKSSDNFQITSNERASILSRNNISVNNIRTFTGRLQGFCGRLNPDQIRKLKQDASIESIEPDRIMSIVSCNTSISAQEIPWGINRVGYGDGTGKTIWIIDTGVDLDHPDLNVDVSRSRSFITGTTPDDDHGHGSHVAGTIAAKNNNIGVLGVAANATIVALKVMDGSGNGSTSNVIAAVDYISNNAKAGDVVNMSIGGDLSETLDSEILNTADRGIFFAIAAGNSSTTASSASPSRVNHKNVFTVSAMDSGDSWASFSNFGNDCVDFCAPGVNISSTHKNGGYATMNGTSMATPHVAGLLLLKGNNILTDGFVKNDPDGTADPIAHK